MKNNTELHISPTFSWSVRCVKNKSWLQSIKLLFTRVLFAAPSSLLHMVKDPAFVLLVGLITLPVLMFLWALNLVVLIVLGLFGRLSLPLRAESKETPAE